LSDFIV